MSEALLNTFVTQLAHELEVKDIPQPNEKGLTLFHFSNDLDIGIGIYTPGIYFTAKLGACPKENLEEFFSTIMLANLFGQGTGGSVLSLDEEAKWVYLSRHLPFHLSYPQFKDYFEEFVNYTDLWQKKTSDALNPSFQVD